MPYTSEIEKLERRYAENPKGRNFAPLADAYRKAGQVDQAIELCKSGLERHPDYVSAHIVYGRCLIDQKNAVAADQVFRKVLELDPENVIAFKVLADIAEHSGRFSDAVIWLTKLLAADPMNGDAAEALAVAKGKAKPTAPTPAVPGVSEAATAAIPKPDFVVEHTSVQPIPPAAAAPAPAGDLETFDGTLDFNAVAHDAAKAEGLEVQEEVVLKPSDVVVEGLARTQYEGSGMFKLDPSAATARAAPPPPPRPLGPEPEEDDLPTVDLPLIMPEDVAPRPAPARRPMPPPVPSPPPAPPPPPPPPPPPVAAAVRLSDDDGAADTAALSRAEPVLTETMAELYLKQGHPEDALRVYQALLARRPADARLRARVDALSGRGMREAGSGKVAAPSGPTVQAFLRTILAARPGAPAPITGASPLDSAFGVTPADAEPGGGQPTHVAADTISLDQVFGDDSGRSSSFADAPAMAASLPPPPAPPSPAAPVAQTGGFSFDEFFGTGGGAEGATGGGAPLTASRPPSSVSASGRRPKVPVEEHGDLDQFQAWLKGLKG